MTKAHPSDFRFRRMDTIGAASAEEDIEFLKTSFVETEEYEVLKDQTDIRQIVLGRTGSGKSALFERLKIDEASRFISIDPHGLALTYVSNSSVIKYFSDLGVNLTPFYKLLWRHVLTVELLRKHFGQYSNDQKSQFWGNLVQKFSNESAEDKRRKQAVEYLREWGESFWQETELRVKEITTKLEDKLTTEIKTKLGVDIIGAEASVGMGKILSDEEKTEVIHRGQHIVSEAQVQDLSRVVDLLEQILSDRQKYYYILIDRLDENWIEGKLRYRLIMALIDSLKEISRVPNVKILVAIRRDLIDRVFRLTRGEGFQEEKYESLYLPLRWSADHITKVLDRRIDTLVTRRYQKNKEVTHRDLLPREIGKVPIKQFITDRAQRPRDVIGFFNKCIEVAEGKPRLNVDTLRRAEGEYSRQRLKALGDEWSADYNGLLDFVNILKNRSASFLLSQIQDDEIANLCLESAINYPEESGTLRTGAKNVVELLTPQEEFKRILFMVFYRTGLIGLKLETFPAPSWASESGQGVSTSEIIDSTRVVVYTTYHRALGIRLNKRN